MHFSKTTLSTAVLFAVSSMARPAPSLAWKPAVEPTGTPLEGPEQMFTIQTQTAVADPSSPVIDDAEFTIQTAPNPEPTDAYGDEPEQMFTIQTQTAVVEPGSSVIDDGEFTIQTAPNPEPTDAYGDEPEQMFTIQTQTAVAEPWSSVLEDADFTIQTVPNPNPTGTYAEEPEQLFSIQTAPNSDPTGGYEAALGMFSAAVPNPSSSAVDELFIASTASAAEPTATGESDDVAVINENEVGMELVDQITHLNGTTEEHLDLMTFEGDALFDLIKDHAKLPDDSLFEDIGGSFANERLARPPAVARVSIFKGRKPAKKKKVNCVTFYIGKRGPYSFCL